MINGLKLYNLRNGEYAQFFQDIINAILLSDPIAMQVKPEYNALVAASREIEALFKIPTGSPITAELKNFDILRGNALKGISAIVRGNTYSQNTILKNHAIVVDTHLALFGNIVEDNYQSETSSIRNILADWNTNPELTAAIATLNLADWQADLENANNNFADKYLHRAIELSNKNPVSLKAKRLEANAAYYALRDKINAHYTVTNGGEPYKTVVTSMNSLISFYNDALGRRGGGENDKL